MKTEFPQQIFGKVSDIKFNQNPSSVRAELFHAYLRTDGHDGANSRFSQFCERASNSRQEQIADKKKGQEKNIFINFVGSPKLSQHYLKCTFV